MVVMQGHTLEHIILCFVDGTCIAGTAAKEVMCRCLGSLQATNAC